MILESLEVFKQPSLSSLKGYEEDVLPGHLLPFCVRCDFCDMYLTDWRLDDTVWARLGGYPGN